MAATGLNVNWTSVSFGNTTLSRINSVQFSRGGSLLTYKGDNQIFDVAAVNVANKPRATVNTSDPGSVMALIPGATGSFTATHKDAKGAAGGDVVYTMANAVIENNDASGSHSQFGTATLSIVGLSTDGTTNPLAITRS